MKSNMLVRIEMLIVMAILIFMPDNRRWYICSVLFILIYYYLIHPSIYSKLKDDEKIEAFKKFQSINDKYDRNCARKK